ncbi:hypothetical protein HY571_01610, partial [Candidatus Micrarchaeota archaeon]|nr:hypothetical protein [Candidatus Micrarchaeota archaeon]
MQNMKNIYLALFLLAALGAANAASTTCGLISLDYNDAIALNAGEAGGSFTLTAFNQGTTTQRISASAQCDEEITCSFSGIGSDALIAPGQQRVFHLNLETNTPGLFVIPAEFRAGPSGATCATELQFTASVNEAASGEVPPITASIAPEDFVNARPGDTVNFRISVKNNLNKRTFATISSKGTNPFEASTTLSASNIALESGETKTVNIRVTLPAGTPGARFQWIYNVDAGNCCDYSVDLPVEVVVDGPVLEIELLGAPVQGVCRVVNTGETARLDFSLDNRGEAEGPFDLSIQGSSTVQGIVSVTEPRFALAPGEEKPFQVVIAPRRNTPLDTYNYRVRGSHQGFVFLDRSFCFKVSGVESASISAPSNIVIERGRISSAVINMTNTGTIRDEYALTIEPGNEVVVEIQPSGFSLNPGETSLQVSLAITSDLSTPLGPRVVELRLDAQNYSRNIALNATVYATGRTGESLLSVTGPREVSLPRGISRSFEVTVENVGTSVFPDVEVLLEGVDAGWYESDSRTILPGGSEVFEVIMTIPQTAEEQIEANVTARSGQEFVSTPLSIIVTDILFDFVITEIIENINAQGETTSVDLILNLSNNGRTTATQITPVINSLDYVYVQRPESVTLQPGQSAQIAINLRAGTRNTADQNFSLQFASQE